jgi:hypothetical protein
MAVDTRGRTALHHFAGSRAPGLDAGARRTVVLRLLRAGCSASARDAAGWSPLDLAVDRKDGHLADAMRAEVAWMRRRSVVLRYVAG